MHDDWKMNYATRKSDWIYIGADINNPQWSKIGKTRNGLETRHRSSQNPTYFIFAAYEIWGGMVNEVEKSILKHIECVEGIERIRHVSTNRKSECFMLNPVKTAIIVENFLYSYYSPYIVTCPISSNISHYRCSDDFYKRVDPYETGLIPDNQNLSGVNYFSGNTVQSEVALGGNIFLCLKNSIQFYRDEDGNEYPYD